MPPDGTLRLAGVNRSQIVSGPTKGGGGVVGVGCLQTEQI